MIKIYCKFCGKEKMVHPYQFKIGKGRYCSKSCALSDREISNKTREKLRLSKLGDNNPMKRKEISIKVSIALKGRHNSPITEFKKGMKPWCTGKKFSNEHIKKLSLSHIGIQSGKNHPMFGKSHSIESRKKIGIASSRCWMDPVFRSNLVGKNHHNWHGGITTKRHKLYNSAQYMQWRKLIFKRDDYTCRKCGYKYKYDKPLNIKLHSHHRIPFYKLVNTLFEKYIFVPDNGITLCANCHKTVHKLVKST